VTAPSFEDLERLAAVRSREAEARRHEAEARRLDAEASLFEAQRAKTMLETTEVELRMAGIRRRDELEALAHEWALAGDAHRNLYVFSGSVDGASAKNAIDWISRWDRLHPPEDQLEIRFFSPGGSVIDGLALFDVIEDVARRRRVVTSTHGYAASMAGILLQAGTHRVASPRSWILIHQVQASAIGSWGELQDRMEWLRRIQDRILDIFAERSRRAAEAGTASEPLTKEQFDDRWRRKDWWLPADEALRHGIVDEVR